MINRFVSALARIPGWLWRSTAGRLMARGSVVPQALVIAEAEEPRSVLELVTTMTTSPEFLSRTAEVEQ